MARNTKKKARINPEEIPMTDVAPPDEDQPSGSSLGDRHAAGTPGGGDETGGLAGSNVGDGAPLDQGQVPEDREEEMAYSGHAGGAVGGTPAEGRAEGGTIRGGLAPGGVHRGDSTVGAKPKGDVRHPPKSHCKR